MTLTPNTSMLPDTSLRRSSLALAADAYRVLGLRLALLFLLTLASALCEGLVLAMLLPLLATLGFASSSSNPLMAPLAALVEFTGFSLTPASVGLFLLGLLAVSAAIFLAQAHFAARLQASYVAHWQRRIFDAVTEAGWPFLRRQRAAAVIGALTTESIRLGGAFYQVNLIATSATFLIIQMAVALLIAPAVTVAMLLLAVVLFAVTQHMVRRALGLGSDLTVANADLLAAGNETMGAMKLIKATAHEDAARQELARHVNRIESLSFRANFDVQIVRAVFEYASGAALIVLLFGAPLLLGVNVISVLIVMAIFVRLFPKVTGLRQCLQSIGLVLPAYDAVRSIADQAAAAREPHDEERRPAQSGPAALALQQVGVRGDAGVAVLENVSLDVPPGSFVTLVGPTGAGKTTMVDCILGLVRPASGTVLVDGAPLASLALRAWRRSIGYLGQDPVLFSGTIRDNVSWGRADVDEAAVLAALRAADAAFVLGLPQGMDTDIRHWGSRLSGGERQRIALARALLGRPRLLILDEATSALDVETERNIIDALRARRSETTIVAITHRLAVVRNADLIVMMENGRVVEQGSYSELRAAGGRFAAFSSAELEDAVPSPGLAIVQ